MELLEKREKFIEKLSEIYTDNIDIIFQSIKTDRKISFRLNSLKFSTNTQDLLKKYSRFFHEPGPFPNTFLLDSVCKGDLTSSELSELGLIYVQGLASMLPVLELSLNEDDKILDMCAAPGSKTSLAAALSENKAYIVALDNNIGRINAMKSNLTILGVENVTCIRADAATILNNPAYINAFDKIIADVPCSNEGMIRRVDSYDFSKWNFKLSQKLPKLQRRILFSGLSALKPGGTLVYSTCTYSPYENEDVVNWALTKFSDVHLEEIHTKLPNLIPGFTSFKNKSFSQDLSKTVRVLPNDSFDGFYLAKFVKSL